MNCPKCSALLLHDASVCASCGAQVTADREPKDPLLGQILDHKYIVKKVLGGGGFGAVYLAEEPGFDRKVAIKTMHVQHTTSPMLVGRFQREGMAASKLEHPCAVRMFNYGKTPEGIPWLAMEFLEGETLGEFLDREGPLTPPMLLAIFAPICEVLEEAHERGIIHRDLKPDNIMLVSSRGKMQPKLLDFGIAALLDDPNELTKTGVMSGTPTYMPPEQWEGLQATDARSDIYSLGFILYQCLAGRLPFTAESTPGWIRKHCFEPSPELSSVSPSISAALSSVVMRCIEKKPEDRYQSIAALRRALKSSIQPEIDPLFDSAQTLMAPVLPKKQPTPSSAPLEKTSAQRPPQTQLDDRFQVITQSDTVALTPTPPGQTLDLIEEAGTVALNKESPALRPPVVQPPLREPLPALSAPKRPAIKMTASDLPALIARPEPVPQPPAPASRAWLVGLLVLLLLVVGALYTLLNERLNPPPLPTPATLPTSTAATQPAPIKEPPPQTSPANMSLFPTPKRPGRFWTNDDGTVTDSVTGLTWAASDNGENVTYDEALAYLKKKGAGWRIPTASELKELYLADIRKGVGPIKLTGHYVWADHKSKIELDYDCLKKKGCIDEPWAFVIAFNNGTVFRNRRSVYNGRILPVRLSK